MHGAVFDTLIGLLGGLVLAGTGVCFAVRIAARHKAMQTAKDGSWDVWTTWGVGVLLRLFLLGLMTWAVWAFCERFALAMLVLSAVYLVGLFVETAWLYRRLCVDVQGNEHG